MYRVGCHLRSALVVVLLCAGLVAAEAAQAGSAADLTITLAGHPGTVSPPGGSAVYRATVKNSRGRRTFTAIEVVTTLGNGSRFDRALTGAACSNPSGDAITVVCSVGPLAPGLSASVDIFAAMPLTVGQSTATASITMSSPLDDRRNNTTDPPATILVVSDPNTTSGFFTPGAYPLGNEVLTVPASASKGLVTAVSQEDSSPLCGPDCLFSDNAVKVDFPLQDPAYSVEDPFNPLTLQLDMGFLTPPCRGLGGTCDDLRFVDHLGRTGIVPFCEGASGTSAGPAHALPSAPCKYHQFKDVDGRVNFEIAFLSNDPTFF